jgi:hypothetical protein
MNGGRLNKIGILFLVTILVCGFLFLIHYVAKWIIRGFKDKPNDENLEK